ncbi:hypothetical protein [Streptomyces canus]|uniref:hypothetical protein n=1 Tax=Streptomyces canus TaxID=58343 RepID=UPI002E3487E9|nr:hypothetical protein [Streptomyces canus]
MTPSKESPAPERGDRDDRMYRDVGHLNGVDHQSDETYPSAPCNGSRQPCLEGGRSRRAQEGTGVRQAHRHPQLPAQDIACGYCQLLEGARANGQMRRFRQV